MEYYLNKTGLSSCPMGKDNYFMQKLQEVTKK
jgi:hypothetical protein